MITTITTKAQLAALEAAVNAAADKARELCDTEDGGTCNFDTCVLNIKIPKKLREATSLHLDKCTWGYYRGCYFVQDIPHNGCGNRRTRQAEAAEQSLRADGYDAHVYYEMD